MTGLELTGCEEHDWNTRIFTALRQEKYTLRAIARITSEGRCHNQLCGLSMKRAKNDS